MTVLERDQFREAVFARDGYRCVRCGQKGQDAHHIIERRLFPGGGYYLDNGATLCGACHLDAESTKLSANAIRDYAGIITTVLPPHLYPDENYDKWGNVILPNGRRLKGELFGDVSVQKVLAPVLHLFDNRVKYPRTYHLPWSPGVTNDDRTLSPDTMDEWDGVDVVVTEKMDGENTTMYRDYIHARSVDYNPHISRNWVRNLHAQIAHDIPENYRICGENLWARHSIAYNEIPSYFLVFSVWDGLYCLSWEHTVEWAELLGLRTVPVIYRGIYNRNMPHFDTTIVPGLGREIEGYVIRPAGSFSMRRFPYVVGKYVRKDHVQTHGHWMRSQIVRNVVKP